MARRKVKPKHAGMRVERVTLDDLIPHDRNPRAMTDEARAGLHYSLDRFGLVQPVCWNERTGNVVGGHQRLRWLREQGYTSTDVVIGSWSDDDELELLAALNNPHAQGQYTDDLGALLADVAKRNREAFDALQFAPLALDFPPPELDPGDDEPGAGGDDPPDDGGGADLKVEALTDKGEAVELGPHVLHCRDCVEVMRDLPDNSVDAVCTDPPYGLSFMQKAFDTLGGPEAQRAWHARWAAEALRVCKPGAHLIAFGGQRTVHRLATALEDVGWEIRDLVGWLFWSGFPKSHDVGKALDKAMGAKGELLAVDRRMNEPSGIVNAGRGSCARTPVAREIRAPATDAAKRWHGWGTALKPALEPFVLARKPLDGTIANNVLKWGTGGLNINACRIVSGDKAWPGPQDPVASTFGAAKGAGGVYGDSGKYQFDGHPLGRWPANVYHCPKVATSEREAGCDDLNQQHTNTDAPPGTPGSQSPRAGAGRTAKQGRGNNHPTVKPVRLMHWLLKLVSPPGATVLEPFAGSGSTLVASVGLDLRIVGAEMDPHYCDIVRARWAHAVGEGGEACKP